jgi:NTE family protein
LAGGAARGAYEVGALEYIVEQVAADLGYDPPLDILCGTSVGAVNVGALAAYADEPRGRVARLVSAWQQLRVAEIVRPRTRGLYGLLHGVFGKSSRPSQPVSLFDMSPLERIIRTSIPFDRIETHLRAGRLHAVTATATQIATGRTVVFVQRRKARAPLWDCPANVVPRAVRLRSDHALASAALPILFPPVKIDGRYYCDGGLRQNVPLSPARRLGAEGLVVVNPLHRKRAGSEPLSRRKRSDPRPSPLFLLGKTLNALMLDRIDHDIDRLEKINDILDAGRARYGDDFAAELSRSMGYEEGRALRRLSTVHIRSSVDIGSLSAAYVRSKRFRVGGVLGRLMREVAEAEATREADLLSYVLFDGPFTSELIERGRQDARTHHDELCELFESFRVR